MKRPRIPAVMCGVWVVNRNGAAGDLAWYRTRAAARRRAASRMAGAARCD